MKTFIVWFVDGTHLETDQDVSSTKALAEHIIDHDGFDHFGDWYFANAILRITQKQEVTEH